MGASFAILLALFVGGFFLFFDAICGLVGKQKYLYYRLGIGLLIALASAWSLCTLN